MTGSGVGAGANGQRLPSRRVWPAEAKQLAAMRAEVHRWLAPLDLPDDAEHDLVLAVNEAASNAIEHAYRAGGADRGVELAFWLGPDDLHIAIIDCGTWREPPSGRRGRGFGLEIIRRLVPGVAIDHDLRGTRILLQHPLPRRNGRLDMAVGPVLDDGAKG